MRYDRGRPVVELLRVSSLALGVGACLSLLIEGFGEGAGIADVNSWWFPDMTMVVENMELFLMLRMSMATGFWPYCFCFLGKVQPALVWHCCV